MKKDIGTDVSTHFGKGKHIGFLAQEVKEIIPEAVHQDEKGTLAIDYSTIIPVLIQGFKEQQAIIETQNDEIAQLKQDFKKLEKEIIKNPKQE